MSFIDISGRKIYYEEYGRGNAPTLVYLHGGPGESCLTYTCQAKRLGEFFHVISFDQYGVFRSDPVGEEALTVRELVRMTEEMRKALGVKSWIPLGHSFGGMLALLYASAYPDSTDGVIYDCPMWSALHTARAIASAVLPFFEQNGVSDQAELCREILEDGISPRDAFEKSMTISLSDELSRYCHVITDEKYNSYIEERIPDPEVAEDCWRRFAAFQQKLFESEDFYEDCLPLISKITKPQFLMLGEYDMTCGRTEQEFFAKNAPIGWTEIIPDCAHLTWFEYPDKYTELIRRNAEAIVSEQRP